MQRDQSNGWDEVADTFIAVRSDIGVSTVAEWAKQLPQRASIVDVGCGSGAPIAIALAERGFTVAGIDASPRLVDAFRLRFPEALVACEEAEHSTFFDRQFDGAIAIGVIFILPERAQLELIGRIAGTLNPGGRFLFTAPKERHTWDDLLTGQRSTSLGGAAYERACEAAGLSMAGERIDEGGNHYFEALKEIPCMSGELPHRR